MSPKKLSPAKLQASLDPVSILGFQFSLATMGLWMYAEDYLLAAKAAPLTELNMVRFSLTCHAIELLLKASLSVDGESLLTLSGGSFGHDLTRLLTAAISRPTGASIPLSPAHQTEIRKASAYHAAKVFEYPAPAEALSAYASRPDLNVLMDAAEILRTHLDTPCRK